LLHAVFKSIFYAALFLDESIAAYPYLNKDICAASPLFLKI